MSLPARLFGRERFWIAGLLFLAIANSYMDRNTLAVAVNAIRQTFPISDGDFARLNSYFLLAYALMYVGGGRLIDGLGTRQGFLWITVFWSLAVMSHGLATGIAGLAISRLLLGIGEGGGFPAITKAVSEWFPARERSTAIGFVNAGTAAGGILAPPLIALVLSFDGWPLAEPWRWVFFLSGSTGFVWSALWLRDYYPAARHPRLSVAEKQEIAEVLEARTDPASGAEPGIPWLRLFGYRQVWGLMLCKALGDAVWYFIAFWLPKYLMDARQFNIRDVGAFAWLPWAAAGVGCLVMGSFSSALVRRGLSLDAARKLALGAAVSVMPALLLVPHVSTAWVIVPFMIGYFGQQGWSTLVMTLPADLFPRGAVGSVAGLVGFGGALGGILFGELSGRYLDAHPLDYAPIFAVAGLLHIVSFLVVLATIRRVERVDLARGRPGPLGA
jgi:ACS family hexuronate transporter-like MFS transporter